MLLPDDIGYAATDIGIGVLTMVLIVALVKGLGERIGYILGSIGDQKK